MNAIAWQAKALRQLRKVPPQSATEIRAVVSTELTDMTTARNVKALVNHDYSYRLRVGNYRVFFEFDGAVHVVKIEEVRKRNERTY